MDMVLLILYAVVAYWAVGKTLYANYVMFGGLLDIILHKGMVGIVLGPVCIPLAIIKTVAENKNR